MLQTSPKVIGILSGEDFLNFFFTIYGHSGHLGPLTMTIEQTFVLSQGPQGQKIGPVRIVCRFMVTYIKTFNGVLPLI